MIYAFITFNQHHLLRQRLYQLDITECEIAYSNPMIQRERSSERMRISTTEICRCISDSKIQIYLSIMKHPFFHKRAGFHYIWVFAHRKYWLSFHFLCYRGHRWTASSLLLLKYKNIGLNGFYISNFYAVALVQDWREEMTAENKYLLLLLSNSLYASFSLVLRFVHSLRKWNECISDDLIV